MAVQQSTVVGLFILLVVQAAQDVPGVSARNLFDSPPSSALTSGFTNPLKPPTSGTPAPPGPPGIVSGIANALKGPPTPPLGIPTLKAPVPALNIPGADDITSGISAALKAPIPAVNIPGADDIASGISAALKAPIPAVNIPGADDIVSGISSALKSPFPAVNISGADSVISGISSALKTPPLSGLGGLLPKGSSGSTAQEAPGITITESVSISSKGLGSTTVTATTVIPPLNEIRTPDFKGFFSRFLPKSSPPPPSSSIFPGFN
ncbi:hypothetical protein Mapa_011276 [Marchantia paleacea]|nr:hypothetical protein Mapa_011276 [Marchantia paleacea]